MNDAKAGWSPVPGLPNPAEVERLVHLGPGFPSKLLEMHYGDNHILSVHENESK